MFEAFPANKLLFCLYLYTSRLAEAESGSITVDRQIEVSRLDLAIILGISDAFSLKSRNIYL